ncbi:MAG: hypothetical protein ACRDGQ_12760, partial [Candidatus Limnocylindrales bacterium]
LSSTGASADRYPDGLPRAFDGQPVLRGSAALARAAAATDTTPFLVGGWVTFIPGSRFCPLAPADGASWARDCIQAQLADAAGTTDDALTAAITFHFVLSGLISGPIVARVEVHDPRATTCGSAVAECDRMMVVQQVLWTGDAATAPGPITAGTATAAVSSVQGGAGLAPLGPSPAFFACSLTLPTATIMLPATMTDTVPGVVEVDVEPTTAARKMALDVGQGVGPAFSRTPLCRGMSGNKGTITNTEDRSLVVANVAVVVHLHGPASAADRAFVDRLVAALEAAASAGAGPTPTPTPMPRAVAPCTSAQLTISTVDSAAEAGTAGAWLRFLNVSAIACSLHG